MTRAGRCVTLEKSAGMELKQYAHIIWKRAWIPVLLVVVVGVVSLLTRQLPQPVYSMTVRFNVAVAPEVAAGEYNYNGLHAWVTSEYMADTLSVLVSGQAFAADVNEKLAEMGKSTRISAGLISAETRHRVVSLSFSWGNAGELADIASAIAQTMQQNIAGYFPQANQTEVLISQVDISGPVEVNFTSLTRRLDVPVRLLLALVAGVALTFLLDYLDDSVRGRAELEAMGIPVLAEVPKK